MYEDHPACFELDSDIEWSEGRKETCKDTKMVLTSMSFLGLPFRETTEVWSIHVPFKIIQLHIIDFQVTCSKYIKANLFSYYSLAVSNKISDLITLRILQYSKTLKFLAYQTGLSAFSPVLENLILHPPGVR